MAQAHTKRNHKLRHAVLSHPRYFYLIVFLIICVAFIELNLVNRMVVSAADTKEEALYARTSVETVLAKRGNIYDRYGNILATSVESITVYANPQEIEDLNYVAKLLSQTLGESTEYYKDLIAGHNLSIYTANSLAKSVLFGRYANIEWGEPLQVNDFESDAIARFVYIKRQLTSEEVAALKFRVSHSGIRGIHFTTEMKRYYPYGDTGAQVIGQVNSFNEARFGLELQFDSILRGVDGLAHREYGGWTQKVDLIDGFKKYTPAKDGKDIVITLDIDMQKLMEEQLVINAANTQCSDANSIVIDGKSGDIYAAASLPLYSRNNAKTADVLAGAADLKALTQSYEPGSTFKATTLVTALESNTHTLDDTMYVPNSLVLSNYEVKDYLKDRAAAVMSVKEIIAQSSNVGTSMIQQNIGNSLYYKQLKNFGFGQATGVDFSAEGSGNLRDLTTWYDIDAANISFGQGVEVTSIQLTAFYSMLANDGLYNAPHFLKELRTAENQLDANKNTQRMLESSTTKIAIEALCEVITAGTGTAAQIDNYQVAGKTGTAEIIGNDGKYETDGNIVSFVGFLANSDSTLTALTSFRKPVYEYNKAPSTALFKSIMQYAIARYNINAQ